MDFLFNRKRDAAKIVMNRMKACKGFIPRFSMEAKGIDEAFSVRNCVAPVRNPRSFAKGPEINLRG